MVGDLEWLDVCSKGWRIKSPEHAQAIGTIIGILNASTSGAPQVV